MLFSDRAQAYYMQDLCFHTQCLKTTIESPKTFKLYIQYLVIMLKCQVLAMGALYMSLSLTTGLFCTQHKTKTVNPLCTHGELLTSNLTVTWQPVFYWDVLTLALLSHKHTQSFWSLLISFFLWCLSPDLEVMPFTQVSTHGNFKDQAHIVLSSAFYSQLVFCFSVPLLLHCVY